MPKTLLLLLCLPCAAVLSPAVLAAPAQQASTQTQIDPALLTDGFLSAHPDLRWRREGIRAYEKGDYTEALTYFRRAAQYADKASQAQLADMYWRGQGTAVDRAIAYAWMDLASERLYPDFVLFRERYWNDLGEAERADAVARGQALYAEYGDDVAKPRLEAVLRRERRKITGSRTGFVGNITIIPQTGPLAGTGMTLSGEQYYAKKYWVPEHYWQLQDEIWRAPARGRVRVGEPERAGDAPFGGDDD